MLVALTIGHTGRRPYQDFGTATRDGVTEVFLSRIYAAHAEAELSKLGHSVVILSDGSYPEQWARVNAMGAAVYVACHVNGGTGRYGLVVYDHRSSNRSGPALAGCIAGHLAEALAQDETPEGLRTVKVAAGRPDTNGHSRDADWTEAYHTISGVQAVAVCYEPFFSQGPQADQDVERLPLIGQALARGIDVWARSRGML